MRTCLTLILAAVAPAAITGFTCTAAILTGDPTTTVGVVLHPVGNALQSTGVIWAGGSTTRSVSFYSGVFVHSSSDTATATFGNGPSVGGDGWEVGDRVVAFGSKVNNAHEAGWLYGETAIMMNPGGAGTYTAAEFVGGPSSPPLGFSNSVNGDFALQATANSGNQSRVTQFLFAAPVGTVYPLQAGGSQTGSLLANPFRSYRVLAAPGLPGAGTPRSPRRSSCSTRPSLRARV